MIVLNGDFNFLDIFLSMNDCSVFLQIFDSYFSSFNSKQTSISKRSKRLSKRK